MRVSAKAEYACVAMMELAASATPNQPVRIRAIAEAHNIPQRFLVQILLQLKTAGLVASVRGAAGGYQLARGPDTISLADILNAVEDRSQAARSVLGQKTPPARTLGALWRELQAEEQRLLDKITLAELVTRAREGTEMMYQI